MSRKPINSLRRKAKAQEKKTWLSEENPEQEKGKTFQFYKKFTYNNIEGEIGDFVLISNADMAESDTEDGCNAARILSLYEDPSNTSDPFRAEVQWFSRPQHIAKPCINVADSIVFLEREVLEDHRPFDTDVSIETFFKRCTITLTFTKDTEFHVNQPYNYICRYRLMPISKRKFQIEPVLEQERKALELLRTPTTPSSLTKRLSRISVSAQKNWSVSQKDGTKLLPKRALLTDKIEKSSPRAVRPIRRPKMTVKSPETTPKTEKDLNKKHREEILSMELKENSDEDKLPILVMKSKYNMSDSGDKLTPHLKTPRKPGFTATPKAIGTLRTPRAPKTANTLRTPKTANTPRTPKTANTPKTPKTANTPRTPKTANTPRTPKTANTPRTPKTGNTPRTPKTARTPRTPTSAARRIKTSQLTPSLQPRAHSIVNIDKFLKDDKSLPGREKHIAEILSFVRSKLLSGTSGCMYISGVPGTGKTASVCAAVKILKEDMDVPEFQSVEVNGMKIAEPRQAYVQIYKQLTGQTLPSEQACSLLGKRFTKAVPRRVPTVLIVDELDALCTRRQDVLYNIVEWASHDSAMLTVLAIANTMDLPERAMKARVASRVGLTRLNFHPYTHTQLEKIVEAQLTDARVTPDALNFIARKVAAVSGDARRAVALCSRAIELAGDRGAGVVEVDVEHVERAVDEAATSVTVRLIQDCPPAERLILRAVVAEVEKTGTDEVTLSRVLATAGVLMALEGRPYKSATSIRPPTYEQAEKMCWRLYAKRLLLIEDKPGDPRLLLNVSVDDVHYANRQIN